MKPIRLESPDQLTRFITEHGALLTLHGARQARGVSRQRIAELITLGRLTPVIVFGETQLIMKEVLNRGRKDARKPADKPAQTSPH